MLATSDYHLAIILCSVKLIWSVFISLLFEKLADRGSQSPSKPAMLDRDGQYACNNLLNQIQNRILGS
jgi:hypothetical protein